MKSRLPELFFIAITLSLGYLSFSLGRQVDQNADRDGTGPLFVDEMHLDLGELTAVEEYQFDFPIKNTGPDTLKINNISPGCRCSSVSPTQFILEPGESKTVSVTADLMPRTPQDMSKPYTDRSLSFRVDYSEQHNENPTPETYRISFALRSLSPFHLSASSLIFDEVFRDIKKSGKTLNIITKEELNKFTVQSTSDLVYATLDESQMSVTVVPKSDLLVGDHEFSVVVFGQSIRGELDPFELKLKGKIRVRPGVELQLLSELPTKSRIGSHLEVKLLLNSINGHDFEVTEMRTDQDFGKMDIKYPAGNPKSSVKSTPLTLTITPRKPGLNSCFAIFTIQQDNIEYELKKLFHITCEPTPN